MTISPDSPQRVAIRINLKNWSNRWYLFRAAFLRSPVAEIFVDSQHATIDGNSATEYRREEPAS